MITGVFTIYLFIHLFTISSALEHDTEFLTKLGKIRLTTSEGGIIKEEQRLKSGCFFDIHEKTKSANWPPEKYSCFLFWKYDIKINSLSVAQSSHNYSKIFNWCKCELGYFTQLLIENKN